MNWLAHLCLSEPSPDFLLGSLLPDLLPLSDRSGWSREVEAGMQRHQRIDVFTDSHPCFRRSLSRVGLSYRRFGGPLVDVFYDHILAKDWSRHRRDTLEEFKRSTYWSLEQVVGQVPIPARARLEGMIAGDLLGSYADPEGVRAALDRIGQRLRRPIALGNAVEELLREEAGFRSDFEAFFPELRAHVAL